MDKIHQLNANPWRTVEALADALGVTPRTIWRRLDRGEIEATDTPEGRRYRVCQPADTDDVSAVTSQQSSDTFLRVYEDLQKAQARVAELEREGGKGEVLSEVVDQLTAQLERAYTELAIARDRETAWRSRCHVAEGKLEMLTD